VPVGSTAGRLDASALRAIWPEALEHVKQASKTTWAMLDGAQITATDGEAVTLAVPPSLARRIAEDRNTSLVSDALTKVVGGTWRVTVVAAGHQAGAGTAPPTSRPSAPVAEPDPRDDTDFGPPSARAPAVDPEAEALRLLHDQLGARPVDGPSGYDVPR
jgi:DNA polymerase-3 subunit gamma/tau